MNELARPGSRLVRFGVFELDTQSRELRKAGVRLNPPEQPLQLLECLLEHPGELVDRDELCKRLWPGDTFVDFEHGLNAAIKRLRDVLGDSADSPRFVETVPRRGYRFLAPVERGPNGALEPLEPAVVAQPHRHVPLWIGVVALAALAAAALAWKVGPSRADVPVKHEEMRLVPLSTLSGWSDWPTFSPDGRQVAFSRVEEFGHHHDTPAQKSSVYFQLVGSAETRQLTTNDTDDFAPSWSPDGRRIAFLRRNALGGRIHHISPLGGSALKVSDFAVQAPISWSADGRYLAAQRAVDAAVEESAIWLVPLDGGSPQPLTHTTRPTLHSVPSFSPDGRHLAYASCASSWLGCHVEVVELNSDLRPSGSRLKLTSGMFNITGLAWSRDGRWLVFNGDTGSESRLLRVPADGSLPASAIEVAGLRAGTPATARGRETLAFVDWTFIDGIYRFESGKPVRGVVTSSSGDFQPALSGDGRRLAFCSGRGGIVDIWVAAANGSEAHQLTHGPNQFQCSPRWAPDGHSIVFDSTPKDGQSHLWTIDSDGGAPRQITRSAGNHTMPSWSSDGRWIYFSTERENGRNIWRVNARDGAEQQITQTGSGSYSTESADGNNLLYQSKDDANSPLMAMPLNGGPARQLVDCVRWANFGSSPRGIHYVACGEGSDPRVHLLDPRSGRDRVLGRLEKPGGTPGLAVSADGTTIFYTRLSGATANLMLVENFR